MMMKRMVSLLLCALLAVGVCVPAYAQGGVDANNQIVYEGGTNDEHSDLATVSKTIAQTGNENEFNITLEVTTPIKVKEVKVEQSAAVVVVIDNSGSMGNGNEGTRLYNAKQAARSFVRSFANVNGNAKARRMVAVVEFHNEASIKKLAKGGSSSGYYYWFDVTNDDALEKVAGDDGLIARIGNSAGTSIEAGLLLGQNLLNHFWKKDNVYGWTDQNSDGYWNSINDPKSPIGKNIVFLTDGVTICRIKDGVNYNDIKELDELKRGTDGQISGNDICYADNRYTYDSYETENGKIKTNSEGEPVLKAADQRTRFHYKNAPYTATHQLMETANKIRGTGVKLFGIAVDMPEIYVEKTSPNGTTSATAHEGESDIIKHHITAEESSEDSAYDYYSSTTEWMAENWCDFAYPASNNIPELNSAFSSVLANTVPTWKVKDILPVYISLVGDNNDPDQAAEWSGNKLTWDLQNSKKTTNGSKETYTYTYTVVLDPTKITAVNEDGSVNTNEVAVLPANTQQGVNAGTTDTQIVFPHPTVKSDPATIRVVKVDSVTHKPLPNATFTLVGRTTGYTGTDDNYSQKKSTVQEAGSDAAAVSFNVTGGEYTLSETFAVPGDGTSEAQTKSGVPEGYEELNGQWEIKASFGTITEAPQGFVLSDNNKTATLSLENTRKTGSLTISKEEGASVVSSPIDRDKAFEFDVVLTTETYYGSQVYVPLANKEFQATLTDKTNGPEGAGTTQTVTISTDINGKAAFNASGDFTLGLDDSIVISGLPVGTRAAIREKPHENFELTGVTRDGGDDQLMPTEPEGNYVIEVRLDNAETENDESAPSSKFTNTRKTGSVKVSKTTIDKMLNSTEEFAFKLVVNGGEDYPNVEMKTGVYGAYHQDGAETGSDLGSIVAGDGVSTQRFTLSDGDFVVVNNLPVGFVYTVTEEMTDAQNQAYKGAVSVDNETTDSKIEAQKTPEHKFTNTYRSGSLIVQKDVEGNGAHNGKDFTFKITLDDATIDTKNDSEGNGYRITATRLTPAKPEGEAEDVKFDKGVAYITLKPGERMRFDGMPTQTELAVQIAELSDAEMRGEAETPDGQNEGVKTEEELEAERREEEEKKKDPNYGKLGYADYEVWVKTIANGVSSDAPSAVATGAVYEDAEDVVPLTVLYTNIRRVGDLTIQKKVAEAGDYKGIFDFTLTVTSDRVRPDQINGWYGDLWFKDGVSKFKLGHLQSVTAKELPAGAQYSVVEDSQGHNQSAEGLEGVIVEGGQVWVSVTNWKPFLPETGDDSRLGLMLAVFMCSMAGLALIAVRRRRSWNNG